MSHNEQAMAAEALAHRPKTEKAPRKKVVEIHAKKMKGGYHVTAHHAHPAHKPEESVHPDLASVQGMMNKHWGAPEEGEAPAEGAEGAEPEGEAPQE